MATQVTFKDGKRLLVSLLKVALARHGFHHVRDLSFARESGGSTRLLSFGAHRGTSDEFCFSFGVGVRFPAVEALLRPEGEDDLLPTVGKPLSILKESEGFPQWCFDGTREPADLVTEATADVERYALPFLDKYSSLSAVRVALEREDPRDWFVLSPEQRLATLVAIDHVEGRTAEALQRLDRALKDLENEPLKKRWPLQKLRERLTTDTA